MTARNRFELEILCPNCGAIGNAHITEHARVSENAPVSENADPDRPALAFRVDEFPLGFSEEQRSGCREQTMVRCECGQVFYLL